MNWIARDYGSHARQEAEFREVCGQEPEEDYVDRLMAELDAVDITPVLTVQGRLFIEGDRA